MNKSSVQGALRRVVLELKLRKRVHMHTLRHSYATHLLEAGHRKVLGAILACRTGQLGTVVYTCSKCGRTHNDGRVTFSYRKSGTNHWRKMTVDALEFIRRFLQHVLPSGFQKVRHYGFLSAGSKVSVEAVRWLLTLHNGERFALLSKPVEPTLPRPRIHCAECGGTMRITSFQPASKPAYHDTS